MKYTTYPRKLKMSLLQLGGRGFSENHLVTIINHVTFSQRRVGVKGKSDNL